MNSVLGIEQFVTYLEVSIQKHVKNSYQNFLGINMQLIFLIHNFSKIVVQDSVETSARFSVQTANEHHIRLLMRYEDALFLVLF